MPRARAKPSPGRAPASPIGAAPAPAAPFEPRPIDRSAVAAVNRLCRRRAPVAVTIAGVAAQLHPQPVLLEDGHAAESFAGPSTVDLVWTFADRERATLSLPRSAVERILSALDPALVDLPGEPTRSLLIELALAPLLDAFEQHAGTRVSLEETRVGPDRGAPRQASALAFRCGLGGVPHEALLRTGSPQAAVAGLELLARAVGALPVAASANDLSGLTFPLEVRAGTVRLPLSALADLRPGDVLVPDDFALERGRVAVVVQHLSAAAVVDQTGLRVQDPLRPERTLTMEFDMTIGAAPPGDPERNTTFDDLQVTLVFELGRSQVDLATLRSIAPGYVFPLVRDPTAPVDIVASGRCIGKGEIVRIGDTLGVRTTRLFGHE